MPPARTASLCLLAAWRLLLTAGSAAADPPTLRWVVPEDESVAGFVLYLGRHAGRYEEAFDLGWVSPDGGLAEFGLESLPSALLSGDTYVVVTAYYANESGGITSESALSNEIFLPFEHAAPSEPFRLPEPDVLLPSQAPEWAESFQGLSADAALENWVATGRSVAQRIPALRFRTRSDAGGNVYLSTPSGGDGVHLHYTGRGSEAWSGYEFSGRFYHRGGAVGVTINSQHPQMDRYYALRYRPGEGLHLHADRGLRGSGIGNCIGRVKTRLELEPDRWHSFRLQAYVSREGTKLQARAWPEDRLEPIAWPIRCIDKSPVSFLAGRPGVWAEGGGEKRWDDLLVQPIDSRGPVSERASRRGQSDR